MVFIYIHLLFFKKNPKGTVQSSECVWCLSLHVSECFSCAVPVCDNSTLCA